MTLVRPQGPVPGLFDRQSINLIIGTSGAAKSPFLLNQLETYATGGGFLNYAPAPGGPVQMGLIGCSGSEGRIIDDVAGFPFLDDQSRFPFEFWKPKCDETDVDALERTYLTLNGLLPERSPVKLLIIEDFQSIMTSGDWQKVKPVKDFCRGVHQFCHKHDVTIIGTVGTGKAKVRECYPQIADRIFGASCWGAEVDSLIAIELIDLHKQPESRPETRRIIVKTRKAPIAVHWGKFVDGRLDVSPDYIPIGEIKPTDVQLQAKLEALAPGEEIKKKEFIRWAEEVGISVITMERWVGKQIDAGSLKREGKSNRTIYRKPYAQ